MQSNKKVTHSPYSLILALIVGVVLAVGGSVWATTIGTNISSSGTLSATNQLTISASNSASSSISYALGVGTSTPAMMFSVGGEGGNVVGHGYFTGGVGVGTVSTSTSGSLQISGAAQIGGAFNVTGISQFNGNVVVGDAAADTFTVTSNSITYSNAGTTTIPSASANAWSYATSSANIPLVKLDTSNTRIGISTTTPAVTLSVGGAGHIYALGGIGAGVATTTAGSLETSGAGLVAGAFNVTGISQFNGNVVVGDAAADTFTITSNSVTQSNAGTTTVPSASVNAWSYATTSAGLPLLKFDTSNTRVGVGTSTPGAALAVAQDGTALVMGGAGTSSIAVQSGQASRGGCIELETTTGTAVVSLMATSSGNVVYWTAGGCR